MNTYIYKTLTGNIPVELDEKWHDWLTEADETQQKQERRHSRSDHKYAPGEPISLNADNSLDDWLVFSTLTSYKAIELKIDLEMALETLTALQRRYFALNRICGYSNSEIARTEKKDESAIRRSVEGAEKKIKLFMR